LNPLDERMVISEFYEFGTSRELIIEAEKTNQPIIMSGIMQKANALNKNGRVYPRAILEREVEKYLASVRDNTAGGELDHPDCQDFMSMILTSQGWKSWRDVTDNEVVATLNVETNEIEYQKIEKRIDQHYKGEMFHFTGKNIDQMVTPNHRFLIEDRNGKRFYKTAAELYEYRDNKWKLPKKGDWIGEEMEFFTIPGMDMSNRKSHDYFIKEQEQDIKVKAEDWFEFMGWWLAEGHVTGSEGYDYEAARNYSVSIHQVKNGPKEEIRALQERLPFRKSVYEKNGKASFRFTDLRLHEYLKPLGNSHNKYIPEELKKASPRLLKIMFDAFMKGDGRNVKQGPNGQWEKQSVFSTSKQLIYDLQEVLVKIGGCGNISEWQPKDRVINEWKEVVNEVDNGDGTLSLVRTEVMIPRTIKAENSVLQYNLNISSTEFIYLDKRMMKIEKVAYNDRVYCVRVKNGNFYTMRNGKAHWTGNSAVISLTNVSHKVLDLWWDGDTLYGKVQIAETKAGDTLKGLLKTGFKLGISSRGVGSVKSQNGHDVVQEDFELIAFDFVSSPSTPGAFLFRESRSMKMLKIGGIEQVSKSGKYSDLKEMQNNKFWKSL